MGGKIVKIRVDCSKINTKQEFFYHFVNVLGFEWWASCGWDSFDDAMYGFLSRHADSARLTTIKLYRIGIFGLKSLARRDRKLGDNIDGFFEKFNTEAERRGIRVPIFEVVLLPFPDADF